MIEWNIHINDHTNTTLHGLSQVEREKHMFSQCIDLVSGANPILDIVEQPRNPVGGHGVNTQQAMSQQKT